MDIAFLLGVAALWAVMALLVFGFKKLENQRELDRGCTAGGSELQGNRALEIQHRC